MGEARTNQRMFADLASSMGFTDEPFDWSDEELFKKAVTALDLNGKPASADPLLEGRNEGYDFPGPGPVQFGTVHPKTDDGRIHLTPAVLGPEPFAYVTPDEEYPLVLSTGRVLYHYHTGTMTRRSGPLDWVEPRGYVEINPADAEAVGVLDDRAVVIESRRGTVKTRAKLTDNVPKGTIFLAFHWREAPANMLTQDFALDPVAKIPEYKVCAVRLINPRAKPEKVAA